MIQALQARNVELPVFLSDDSVSPVFATVLDGTGGSLSLPLTTAGLDTDDVAALAPGTEGAAVSAYLAALRATAEDGDSPTSSTTRTSRPSLATPTSAATTPSSPWSPPPRPPGAPTRPTSGRHCRA